MTNGLVAAWPPGAANAGWMGEPSGRMPGRVQGWPAGTQRAANAAQRLLSQAVAWWDVEQYRDGDRFLRNRGTGGELLDLRLGSSIAANSNDPKWLGPEDSGYVYLPGSSGNFLSVPDENALDITGDIDIRVRVALDSWTPAAQSTLLAKYNYSGNSDSYAFGVTTSGTLRLQWQQADLTNKGAASTVAAGIANGGIKWVRVTLDVDNGSSGYDVKFYLSDDGVTWTQLGSTVTAAGITNLQASTTNVGIGASPSGSVVVAAGSFYRAIVKDGIDGTTVLDVDCDAITSGSATSFTAKTGQIVTINRSTSGRKSVAVPSRHRGGRPVMLLGSDDFLEIPAENGWQHGLLNINSGDSLTAIIVARKHSLAVQVLLSKKKTFVTSADSGWGINTHSNGTLYSYCSNGTTQASADTGAGGALITAPAVGTFVIKYTPATLATTLNGVSNNATSPVRTHRLDGSLYTLQTFRIGAEPAYYADMEFYAAAVFRRALSAAEIQLIADYYAEKQTTYYLPTKAEQTTYLAGQLGLSATTDAAVLDVLSDATFYVDSTVAKPGERYVKNLGINRDTLNVRYGSAQTANTNDPLLLQPESTGYVYLPGANIQNNLRVPIAPELRPPSLDVSLRMAPEVWNIATNSAIAGCYEGSAAGSMWYIESYGSGNLRLAVSNGTSLVQKNWVIPSSFKNGSAYWIRFTYNSSTGDYSLYWANDSVSEPTAWTLVSTQSSTTGAMNTSVSTDVAFGSYGATYGNNYAMKCYRMIMRDSIGGSVVLDVDCDAITSGSQTSFTARTGQVVRIVRNATGRKSVAVPKSSLNPKGVWLFGTDDYFEVESPLQHDWLNVNQWQSFTLVAVARHWATQGVASLVSKGNQDPSVMIGWDQSLNGAAAYFLVGDGTTRQYRGSRDVPYGAVSAITHVLNRDDSTLTGSVSGSAITTTTQATGSYANLLPLRIGRSSAGTAYYFNGEGVAFSIFPRALTASEIATLTTYFSEKFSITQGPDADRKALLSSALGVASNDPVLDVLKDAVFHVDAKAYTNGSQYVRNLGWGGDLLNPQLGSGEGADSNDPQFLTPESSGYVYLPGVTGNTLSIPDAASMDLTGDMTIIVDAALADWSPSPLMFLVSKFGTSDRAYGVELLATNRIVFHWSNDGTTDNAVTSTAGLPNEDGQRLQLRVIFDADNGAGGNTTTFSYSLNGGSTWVQVGDPVTLAGTATINNSSRPLTIGSNTNATPALTGKIYSVKIYSDTTQTTQVVDINCDDITSGSATSFTARTGQVVSITRSTSGRKSVCVPSLTKGGSPVWLFGTDDYLECVNNLQYGLLNFGLGESFSVVVCARQWATQSANQRWVSSRTSGNGGYYMGPRNTGTGGYFGVETGGSAGYDVTLGAQSTVVATRGNGVYKSYVNGSLASSQAGTMAATAAVAPLRIGREGGGTSNYADCEIYAVLIIDREVTAAEAYVLSDYFAGRIA